jgi:hypothetical protein
MDGHDGDFYNADNADDERETAFPAADAGWFEGGGGRHFSTGVGYSHITNPRLGLDSLDINDGEGWSGGPSYTGNFPSEYNMAAGFPLRFESPDAPSRTTVPSGLLEASAAALLLHSPLRGRLLIRPDPGCPDNLCTTTSKEPSTYHGRLVIRPGQARLVLHQQACHTVEVWPAPSEAVGPVTPLPRTTTTLYRYTFVLLAFCNRFILLLRPINVVAIPIRYAM